MGVATYTKDEKDAIEEVLLQSGIKIKPVYTPEDLERIGFDYQQDLGDPGEYPFTRSLHPLGYRSRNWTTRQYTGFGTPAETNERFKLMISHGQTGLNVAFDLPTQMGYDSDDPMSEGEVGRVGMAVDSLRDFEIAFKDIQLNRIGSGLTINAVASVTLAMYESVAEKFGYKKEEISATPQNDILKEMVGRGAWIYPVGPAVRLIGDNGSRHSGELQIVRRRRRETHVYIRVVKRVGDLELCLARPEREGQCLVVCRTCLLQHEGLPLGEVGAAAPDQRLLVKGPSNAASHIHESESVAALVTYNRPIVIGNRDHLMDLRQLSAEMGRLSESANGRI